MKGLTSAFSGLTMSVPHNRKGGGGGGLRQYDRDLSVYTETDTVMFHEDLRDRLIELAQEQGNDPTLYASVVMIKLKEEVAYIGEQGETLVPKRCSIEGMNNLTMLFVILNSEQAQHFTDTYGTDSYKLSYTAGASVSKDQKLPVSTYIEEGKGTFSIKNNKSILTGDGGIVSFFNPPAVTVEKYDNSGEDGSTIIENGKPKTIKVQGLSDIYFNSIGFVDLDCVVEGVSKGKEEDEYLTAFAVSVQKFAIPSNPGRIKKRKDDTKGEVEDDNDDNDDNE